MGSQAPRQAPRPIDEWQRFQLRNDSLAHSLNRQRNQAREGKKMACDCGEDKDG